MTARPHLVLDGAAIAAETLGADDVVVYIGAEHTAAREAMRRALAERPGPERARTRFVSAPPRYVAGEESAAVHCVNDGVALPTATPPRPFERGIADRPTLVQNVETLAHVAMIARFGAEWFHSIGAGAPGTVLLTLSGAVRAPGVVEMAHGSTVADAVDAAGGLLRDAHGRAARRLLRRLDRRAHGLVDAPGRRRAACRRRDAGVRRGLRARRRALRGARDGAHRLVPRRRERAPVRSLRLRSARHRRGGAAHRRRHRHTPRPRRACAAGRRSWAVAAPATTPTAPRRCCSARSTSSPTSSRATTSAAAARW